MAVAALTQAQESLARRWQKLWDIDRLDQKNLLYINKNRTARWGAARTGAAGSHDAPLAKQSFSTISVPDETDLGKLKKKTRGSIRHQVMEGFCLIMAMCGRCRRSMVL